MKLLLGVPNLIAVKLTNIDNYKDFIYIKHLTIVFFFSDNGAVNMNPNERPYRGGKFSNYEGGHRVPAVAWWPGYIKPGWNSDELIIGMDLLPTIIDILEIDIPSQHSFDGTSVMSNIV